jgi:GntR family transcriptional regulator/MocR family aminotransferase
VPDLRVALSTHLRRTRGLVFEPDEIFVLPGALSAMRTLAAAAELRGKSVVVEDPGYDGTRNVLHTAGARVRGVQVDRNGLDSTHLNADDAGVFVTPAHQFPLGHHMSLARRGSLIEWARSTGNLIVEDDYDGEFRYNVSPSPALASAAHGREVVAYVGTASKMLTPGLRVAWLIPPRYLVSKVRDALDQSQEAIDIVTGRALTHFIESGALIRHLARASRTYRNRRQAFVAAMERLLPQCRILGVDAGLHVSVVLPDGIDANLVVVALRQRGIAMNTIDTYLMLPRRNSTLVVSFANLPESKATQIVESIADVVAEFSGHWTTRGEFTSGRRSAR